MMYHILSGLVYLGKHDHKYREIYLMLMSPIPQSMLPQSHSNPELFDCVLSSEDCIIIQSNNFIPQNYIYSVGITCVEAENTRRRL